MLRNRSMPQSSVVPVLVYPDIDHAADWLCKAFAFTLRLRIGDHRAQLNVGDGAIILIKEEKTSGAISGSVMVRVDDVDGHCTNAMKHNARLLSAPETYPYGERQYSVEDHAGHCWTFSQSVADIDPQAWGGAPGEDSHRE